MATRWEVEKAVLWSDMDPSPRLIVLALLTKSDNATAVVPKEHSPSLTTLTGMTGLARSALAEWLNALEDAGWVKRLRPPAGRLTEQTTYVLLEGAQQVVRRPRARQSAGRTSPLGGPGVVRQADGTSPPSGHATTSPPKPQPRTPSRRRTDEEPKREDVERLCEHLADRIETNGSKRPEITKGWRTAARLMLDKDGRTEQEVMGCINWCQTDEFWRGNILSMPKLRDKYDQLRLQAERRRGRGRRPTNDERVAHAAAVGAQLQAELDQMEIES